MGSNLPASRVFLSLLPFLALIPSALGKTVPTFAFVANASDNTVSIYTVNSTTGLLRDAGYALAGTKPVGAVLTPNGAFLYVANSGSKNVSAFSVNSSTGTLTAVSGSPFAAETAPSAAAVAPSGDYLYVANKTSGNVSAYSINTTTGALTAVAGSPFTAGTSPASLRVDPSGKFLYVANSGSNNISAFAITSSSGALTQISGSPFSAGISPVGLSVTPSGKYVYVANNGSKNVSGFSLNTTTGVLTPISGSPFTAGTDPAAVAVDPNTKFAYIANSSSNNISEFTISSTTGALTAVAGSPISAGTKPDAVVVDPSAKFVYAGNATSDDVSSFTLNSTTGALTAILPGPVRARKGPGAVVVDSGTKAITYAPKYAFVADFAGGVPTLSVNSSTGALTSVKGSPFGSGDPRATAATPDGAFLYTANDDGTNTVGEYSVDTATGALTSVGSATIGESPYSVAVDPSGRFVYAVAIDAVGVYGFTINSTTGVLTAMSGSPFGTSSNADAPDSVAVDPTGRFLMVGLDCCGSSAGVSVFSVAATTGKLTVVSGSPFPPPIVDSAPNWVAVDPTGRYVYSADEGANTGAVAYSIAASTGKLTAVGTEVPGGGNPWSITTDITGSYVYMTNNDATISGYSIENSTGGLTALKGSPFNASVATRGIVADPSGKYLYLSNAEQILGYKITAATGAITELSTSPYTAGSDPLSLCVMGTIE